MLESTKQRLIKVSLERLGPHRAPKGEVNWMRATEGIARMKQLGLTSLSKGND